MVVYACVFQSLYAERDAGWRGIMQMPLDYDRTQKLELTKMPPAAVTIIDHRKSKAARPRSAVIDDEIERVQLEIAALTHEAGILEKDNLAI